MGIIGTPLANKLETNAISHLGFVKPVQGLLKYRVDLEALCVASAEPDLDILLTGGSSTISIFGEFISKTKAFYSLLIV